VGELVEKDASHFQLRISLCKVRWEDQVGHTEKSEDGDPAALRSFDEARGTPSAGSGRTFFESFLERWI
jgi:hypothetical protein